LEGRPEAENLVGIYAALADRPRDDILKEFGGSQFSTFKPALADLAVAKLAPIAAEMRRISADASYVDSVLKDGGGRARARAEVTMREVKQILGMLVD
jgi:tryptophanyl-tRNA synthetase